MNGRPVREPAILGIIAYPVRKHLLDEARWDALIRTLAEDRPALAEALDRGDVVVLDFTAEWCLNCKSLEAAFLSRAPVKPMLLQAGVVPMVADVTSSGAPGWDKLRELGQTGIPLLAVYGPGTDEPWLANNYTGGTVVEAIERARGTGLAGQVPEPASP